jgi:Na+/H+ antiporter NhaD/arsenite permease-like protein
MAFVLSSIIDNLTATIVLVTILQKIVPEKETRLWFASLIIIAANAGGAWSPIGDVTTTMLWIGKKVTSAKLMEYLIIPSILCVVVPVYIASFMKPFQGNIDISALEDAGPKSKYGPRMLYLGLGAIIFVPIFKTITHLPPYVGMMLSLAVVAIFAELHSRTQFNLTRLEENEGEEALGFHSPVHRSLSRIEMPSVLFFFGILMAVAALETLGLLFNGAEALKEMIPNIDIVIIALGISSAVIDNVPLVAASMGMFQEPIDSHLWHFVAYSAGTGGSMLIIGSAAGVVAMGMEKISFTWYLKNITGLAAAGFFVGAIAFMLIRNLSF